MSWREGVSQVGRGRGDGADGPDGPGRCQLLRDQSYGKDKDRVTSLTCGMWI